MVWSDLCILNVVIKSKFRGDANEGKGSTASASSSLSEWRDRQIVATSSTVTPGYETKKGDDAEESAFVAPLEVRDTHVYTCEHGVVRECLSTLHGGIRSNLFDVDAETGELEVLRPIVRHSEGYISFILCIPDVI